MTLTTWCHDPVLMLGKRTSLFLSGLGDSKYPPLQVPNTRPFSSWYVFEKPGFRGQMPPFCVEGRHHTLEKVTPCSKYPLFLG